MQNINLVFLLQPFSAIVFSVGLVIYWRLKRRFRLSLLLYTLIAYVAAIALKDVLQFFTATSLTASFGSESIVTGLYYGLQTAVFEVGIAYVVARYFVSRQKIDSGDAEAYGLGLSFWENGILLGLLTMLDLLAYHSILSTNTSIATTLYSQLSSTQPTLFYSTQQALPLIGFGTIERISSLLLHFSWGYLVVTSAANHKKRYFLIALPMGMVDFFVPFSQAVTLPVFEGLIFSLSVVSVFIAIFSTKNLRKRTIKSDIEFHSF